MKNRRSWLKLIAWGCGVAFLLFASLVTLVFVILDRVPKSYPPAANPIERPLLAQSATNELDGFASPYLGHSGSWDGKGGGMFGSSKIPDLDSEKAMHLRWTFMALYWKALEPDGPVDLTREIPPAWRALDAFVIAAHERHLNILMQAPVIGGNAGGPPRWAGQREKGKSAPENMEAAAAFAGKLAARYAPNGVLARQQGWNSRYGVRAWELDNEPDGYMTHWKNQAADYAEFVTKCASAIRQADAQAVLVGPGVMGGGGAIQWVEGALNASLSHCSPEFRKRSNFYSIGPMLDAVSFHVYEGLDSAFSGKDRTIETVFSEIRALFEQWETRASRFHYERKKEYWHTEGNFDFLGVMSKERRAAWRIQFLTRAFAAGIAKVAVMDPSLPEQAAVAAYVDVLPDPFPMRRAEDGVKIQRGSAVVFRHLDGLASNAGRVWVLWATAGTGEAILEVPTVHEQLFQISTDGTRTSLASTNRMVIIHLKGDPKMAPPVLVVDRPVPDIRALKPEQAH